jgi:hypothetical protein
MLVLAPISFHLDLYAYWQSRRGTRTMPARSNISPADMLPLLRHLIIAEKDGNQFRYRLFGTGVVDDIGYDATGYFAGEYLNNPNFYGELRAVYEMLCALSDPVFVTGEFCFKCFRSGALHAWSSTILPLSDDGITINKAISTLIARLHPDAASSRDWLEEQPAKVFSVSNIGDATGLETLCRKWEQGCEAITE